MEDGRQVPVDRAVQMERRARWSHSARIEPRRLYGRAARALARRKAERTPRSRCAAISPRRNVAPKRKLAEFRVSPEDNLIGVGEEITADHYMPGQYVDIAGTSIGKGFAGAMKRHNFRRPARVARCVDQPSLATARPGSARTRARSSRARRWPGTWVRPG